jgi:hypothetical protein
MQAAHVLTLSSITAWDEVGTFGIEDRSDLAQILSLGRIANMAL